MAIRTERSGAVGGRNLLDIVTLIAALLLIAAPWALGYAHDARAADASWIGGVFAGLIALATLIQFAEWLEWAALVVGAAIILSPWYVGFAGVTHAMAAQVVLGIVVAAASISEILVVHRPISMAH